MSRITITSLFYGALAGAALLWRGWATETFPYWHPEPWLHLSPGMATATSLALGTVLASAVVLSSRWLTRHTRWALALHREFRATLHPFARYEIAVFSLASGIGEELFFRGAMQISIGWILAGLIFGLVHVAPNRQLVPWTLWAVIMGWLFGVIFAATGALLGSVVAHVSINWLNMRFIRDADL